jgi:multiple sugar transport system permease protein
MRKISSSCREKRFAYALISPTVILFILVTLYPLLYSLQLSFQSWNLLKPSLGKEFVGLSNYLEIFKDPVFWGALKTTLNFTVGTVTLQFMIGLGVALILNRDFAGKNVTRTVVLLPLLITPVIIGLMWRWLLNAETGLINYLLSLLRIYPKPWLGTPSVALVTVILVDVWHLTPFTVLVVLAGLQGIDPELYEAARIDGASQGQRFRFLTMPLLSPVLSVILLLITMSAFRAFDKIFSLTQGGPGRATEVLGYLVYRVSFKEFYMGQGAALSFVMLLLVLIIALVYIRLLPEPE